MSCLDELKHLFAAKTKCIWIKTSEEVLTIESIKNYLLVNKLPYTMKSWSFHSGLKDEPLVTNKKQGSGSNIIQPDERLAAYPRLFKEINQKQSDPQSPRTIYVLKDLHLMLTNKDTVRALKDLKEKPGSELCSYQPIIVVSPVVDIPIEVEKLFTVLEFDTPDVKQITALIRGFCKKISSNAEEKGYTIPDEKTIQKCINLAQGLTKSEIVSYLAKSLSKYSTLNSDIFNEARVNLINKTGLLKLVDTNIGMDDMGGNHCFKEWIEDVKLSLTPEAEEFGVERSKGYVGIGIPGTSKTLSAEMIATELNLPLLKFDINKVMNSFVGKSEQNMDTALNVVKACSPCVLLIDEIEKTLSGMQSSGRTDGGTMARVVGSLLQFLSSPESKEVFTIMTSNDISQMPPELTRSGRLDTTWFFGLPTEEERKEIFRIHFGKTPIEVTDGLLNYAAKNSENLTGAEIREVVKVSIRKAFKRYMETKTKEVTPDDIDDAMKEIVPVFNSSKEAILRLENYAKNKARFASEKVKEKTTSANTFKKIDMAELKK